MPRQTTLPTDELRVRYLNGDSTVLLAQAFGCSPTTIAKRLHALGITMRPSRFTSLSVSETELQRLYQDEHLPVSQIAAHFGVSPSTITNKRQQYGIPTRPRTRVKR